MCTQKGLDYHTKLFSVFGLRIQMKKKEFRKMRNVQKECEQVLWVESDATADAEGFVLSHSFDKPAASAMKACSLN